MRRWDSACVLMFPVLLLAFIVRVAGLGLHGMTYDEAASVAFALPDAGHILTYPQRAIYESPPGFYLALHAWLGPAGNTPFALRFLPLCLGVLQIPLIYQLGRRLFSRLVGLLAALTGAASVIQVYYAQEVRMYTLVPLLSLVATVAFARLVTCEVERRGRGDAERESRPVTLSPRHPVTLSPRLLLWVVYVVSMALAILGHYYAGLVLVFHNLYALIAWARGRLSPWTWITVQVLTLAGPVLYLVFASGVAATVANIAGGGDATNNLPGLRGLWLDFALGNVSTDLRRSPLVWVLLAILLLGLGYAFVRGRQGTRSPGRGETGFPRKDWFLKALSPDSNGWFLALYLLAPLAVALVLPYRLAPRYLMTLAPAYYLAMGAGLAALRPVWPAMAVGLAVVLGGNAYTLGAYRNLVKNDYDRLTAVIEAQEQPGDVIVISGPRQHLLLRYYYHGRLAFRPVPAVDLPPWAEVDAPRLDPARAETDMAAATAGASRVWLLLSGEDETDPKGLAERWLNGHASFEFEQRVERGRLRLYAFPAALRAENRPALRAGGPGRFGGLLGLGEVWPPETRVAAGQRVHVMLGWRVLADLPPDLKYTLRLVDGRGERVTQRDGLVGGGYQPPGGRPVGSLFSDSLSLPIPPEVPPGRYQLVLGLYLESSGKDLNWETDPYPLPPGEHKLIQLGEVDVRPRQEGS